MKLIDVTYQLISSPEIMYMRKYDCVLMFLFNNNKVMTNAEITIEKQAIGYTINISMKDNIDYPLIPITKQVKAWVHENLL